MAEDVLDDFDKLLDSFINEKFDEPIDSGEKNNNEVANKAEKVSAAKEQALNPTPVNEAPVLDESDEELLQLSDKGKAVNSEVKEDLNEELFSSLSQAKNEAEVADNQPVLGSDESELAQAFINFQTSVNKLSERILKSKFKCKFKIDDLYPNYKPSMGRLLSDDLVNGWLLLIKMFPDVIGNFSPSSTDEEFLNFSETLNDVDLQLSVISYVEILIDMESCELSYLAKYAKYKEKHIKRIMYEEYLARKERQRKFTEALAKKNFPVNAETLVSNYFRVAQKDMDGAYKALCTNPAIFSPIDFSKIKPRFFGLIKVSPKDGIRINIKIGNFLKKLKV